MDAEETIEELAEEEKPTEEEETKEADDGTDEGGDEVSDEGEEGSTALNATTETVKALVNLVVPLAFMFATWFGVKADISWITEVICSLATVAAFVWAWWKNNNLTEAARTAQTLLDALKAGN